MTEKKDKLIDLKGANSTIKLGLVLYSVMVVAFIMCACVCYAAGLKLASAKSWDNLWMRMAILAKL